MSGICCFDRETKCGILIGAKSCDNCKFFKTNEQFSADYKRAARLLNEKGLESYMTEDGRISVRGKFS